MSITFHRNGYAVYRPDGDLGVVYPARRLLVVTSNHCYEYQLTTGLMSSATKPFGTTSGIYIILPFDNIKDADVVRLRRERGCVVSEDAVYIPLALDIADEPVDEPDPDQLF